MNQKKIKTKGQKTSPENSNKEAGDKTTTGLARSPYKWLLALSIFLVGFLLYSNTFTHGFVLDDPGIISSNRITIAPMSWENTRLIFSTPLRRGAMDRDNSLYRPLTKLTYNAEWNLFDGDPHPFHILNVVLYSLLGLVIFLVFFEAFNKRWVIPYLIALLFIVHPVHSEAVANVKGREEILSLLSIMLSIKAIQLYLGKNQLSWLLVAILSFLPGLFSKESTVIAVALFPLFIYFFSDATIKRNMIVSLVMLAPALFFIFCRWLVLHDLKQMDISEFDNMLLFTADPLIRFSTAIGLLGVYLLKFLVPYPLSCDYSYPTFELMNMNDPKFLASFLVLALMAFLVFRYWKRKSPLAFGFAWFFISISLVSNLFIIIGTSFGERLLFVPSLGLCVSAIWIIHMLSSQRKTSNAPSSAFGQNRLLWIVLTPVLLLFCIKTYSRNEAWKNEYTLFKTDIETHPEAIHMLYLLGNHLSEDYRKQALTNQLTELGYTEKQIADSLQKDNYYSILYLTRSLSIHPSLPPVGLNQLGKAYDNIQQYDSAFKYYVQASNIDTGNAVYANNVGIIHLIKERYSEALPYFQKAYRRDSTIPFVVNNLGRLYGMRQLYDSTIYWFNKTQRLDSTDMTSLEYLELTWRHLGNTEKADYYKQRMATEKEKRAALIKKKVD